MHLQINGEHLPPGVDVVIDDIVYSYDSLANMEASDLANLGVVISHPEPPGLEALKVMKLELVASARKSATRNFSFAGMAIDLDPDTENAIGKAIQAMERKPAGSVIQWEIRRGVTVPLDLPWLYGLGDAAFDHVQARFENVSRLTGLIVEAEDEAELSAIDVNDGWPS